MQRSFVVGQVRFLAEESQLAYGPTRGARRYQAIGATGLALVSVFFALVIAKYRPLGALIDEPDSWNMAAIFTLLIFAAGLLIAIPIYLRSSAIMFVLDAKQRCLFVGNRPVLDLKAASAIDIRFNGGGGEYSGVGTWSLEIQANGNKHWLKLLTFDQREEAGRVAQEISNLLGIPISG